MVIPNYSGPIVQALIYISFISYIYKMESSKYQGNLPITIMSETTEVVIVPEIKPATEVKKVIKSVERNIINIENSVHEELSAQSDSSVDSMAGLMAEFSTISTNETDQAETGHDKSVFYDLGAWLNLNKN
jgi:hypothetical protein